MAQQLATLRTPEAYAAVTAYAHSHTGEAATAAYLALGHAYLLDKRYADAETALAQARRADGELAEYIDFLDAEASHAAGDDTIAEKILHGFTDRYPDSIFDAQEPELEATVLLAMGDQTAARQRWLQPLALMRRAGLVSSLSRGPGGVGDGPATGCGNDLQAAVCWAIR